MEVVKKSNNHGAQHKVPLPAKWTAAVASLAQSVAWTMHRAAAAAVCPSRQLGFWGMGGCVKSSLGTIWNRRLGVFFFGLTN
jgi:hypothetical protein